MTHDPFKLCADATCPHCGVKGRLVAEQETKYIEDDSYDVEMLTCVECGGLHESHGSSGDEHLKAMRVQYGRLIEGRPYEPPKPVVARWDQQEQKPLDMTVFDEMLKKIYAAGPPPNAAIIGGGLVRIVPDPNMPPNSFVLVTDLKTEAPSQSGSYALSADTWTFAPCEHCGEAFKLGHPFACKA